LIDLDRGADKTAWYRWQSQAEVATQVADDHWTVEIRIPVTDDENDPLNQVVGRKPSVSLPWHFNICRQRIRNNGSEHSAFSPTGAKTFHEPMKFAYFYDGRSHQFDVDPTVTDYLIANREAGDLMRSRDYKEALAAHMALAENAGSTDLQRSHTLQHAAACARSLDDFNLADQLAGQIPIEAVAKTVRMENLLTQRKTDQLIEQYGDENFLQWPFWQVGAAALARARALVNTKAGDRAEEDLKTALEFTSDGRTRISILLSLGANRENNLQDDTAALEAYERIAALSRNTGSAEYCRGVLGAARIRTRQSEFDKALATLRLVDTDRLTGYWRGSILLARGETLKAAGRTAEAREIYRVLLADESLRPRQREEAEKAFESLGD
jgi:predicted negative regulator of RcsB-dependent stress response